MMPLLLPLRCLRSWCCVVAVLVFVVVTFLLFPVVVFVISSICSLVIFVVSRCYLLLPHYEPVVIIPLYSRSCLLFTFVIRVGDG